MTVILNRPSQAYNARPNRPYELDATMPAGFVVHAIKVSLTRESWPEGPCLEAVLTFPDGSTAGFSASGGTVLKRDGTILAVTDCQFERFSNGVRVPFPSGNYNLSFRLLQPLSTALTIERFV